MHHLSFNDLKGKTCAITGGGGVIGTALARGLAEVGAKMAILDLKKEFADKTAADIRNDFGTEAIAVESNVLERGSLDNAKAQVNAAFGKTDILINCAGGNSPKGTAQLEMLEKTTEDLSQGFFGLDPEGFQFVFNLNFLGTLLPTMVFAKDMVDSGTGVILNISSMSAFHPLTKVAAYSAAKASINNFTEWLAVHLAKMDIRVNALAPGFFLTNQNRFLLTDEKTGAPTPRGEKIISNTPMGRYGDVDELQGPTLFLCSEVSKFITGVVLPVDGGFNAFSGV